MTEFSDTGDGRRHAGATRRNRDPILAVLRRVLPRAGVILEVAAGTGEHAAYFAPNLPHLVWQPSDADPEMLRSIVAWAAIAKVPNLRPPIALDVTMPLDEETARHLTGVVGVVNINMIHIAPWPACEGLMRVASAVLSPGDVLFLYGPFRQGGSHTAPSNASFDASLRQQNPAWGVRDLEDVIRAAEIHALAHVDTVAMPVNNLSVVFRRQAAGGVP